MRINCDIGERGQSHPLDDQLMHLIDTANIACGGHAGDVATALYYHSMADSLGVEVTAHLSYPDREHFGRISLDLTPRDLLSALSAQLSLLPGVCRVKFHGALYNDSCRDPGLAAILADWLTRAGILGVITLAGGALDRACRPAGIEVVSEAFPERRYVWDPVQELPVLSERSLPWACITDVGTALDQAGDIIQGRICCVEKFTPAGMVCREQALTAETLCIHSDSAIALELACALRERLGHA